EGVSAAPPDAPGAVLRGRDAGVCSRSCRAKRRLQQKKAEWAANIRECRALVRRAVGCSLGTATDVSTALPVCAPDPRPVYRSRPMDRDITPKTRCLSYVDVIVPNETDLRLPTGSRRKTCSAASELGWN